MFKFHITPSASELLENFDVGFDPNAQDILDLTHILKNQDIADSEILDLIDKHRPQIVTAIQSQRIPSPY